LQRAAKPGSPWAKLKGYESRAGKAGIYPVAGKDAGARPVALIVLGWRGKGEPSSAVLW